MKDRTTVDVNNAFVEIGGLTRGNGGVLADPAHELCLRSHACRLRRLDPVVDLQAGRFGCQRVSDRGATAGDARVRKLRREFGLRRKRLQRGQEIPIAVLVRRLRTDAVIVRPSGDHEGATKNPGVKASGA